MSNSEKEKQEWKMGKIEGEREINSCKNIDKEEEIKEQEQMWTVLRK